MSRFERQQQRAKARKAGLSGYRPPKTAQEALDIVRALERKAEDLRLRTAAMDARRAR